jgi:hypothetical protein
MSSIPASLIEAVRDQRAILFLGAGASQGAIHPSNETVPTGESLRDMISEKFLAGQLKSKPLMAVAALAANEVGLSCFQKFIHDILEPFWPGRHHLLLPTFRWKALVTTNYDLIVERAYQQVSSSLQTIVKTVKDGDSFDARMSAATHPVGYYKLHGCIESYTDETIPLILSNEQYNSYKKTALVSTVGFVISDTNIALFL